MFDRYQSSRARRLWTESEMAGRRHPDSAALATAGALCIGVGLGYAASWLRAQRLRRQSSPSWGWGWFTEDKSFSLDAVSTLVVQAGKIPVKSDGGLLWMEVAPEQLLKSTVVSADAVVVPAGGANTFMMDCRAADGELESLLAPHGTYKLVSPRDVVRLAAQGRGVGQPEAEAVVRAASLLAWHAANRFSGIDGTPTLPPAAGTDGRRRKLASGRSLYPRVDPVAICLVISADGERRRHLAPSNALSRLPAPTGCLRQA